MTAKLQIPAAGWTDPTQHRKMVEIASALQGAVDTLDAQVLTAVSQTLTDKYVIRYGEDNTYPYIPESDEELTFTKIKVQCSTGSMTITPKINGVTLGGGASSVTTTLSTVTHTSNNVLPVGGSMTLVGSGTSLAENVVIYITYTKSLATQ